jgi:hypothetical protein
MPADDLILNVRQIAGYPNAGVLPTDNVVTQRGLGGPYLSPLALEFVQGAVAEGGPLGVGIAFPTPAYASVLACLWASIDGIGSNIYLDDTGAQFRSLDGGYGSYFNLRTALANGQVEWGVASPASPGQPVTLTQTMTLGPLGNLDLPLGTVTVAHDPQAPLQVATAQWVAEMIASGTVGSFNGRTGAVFLNINDIECAGGAPNYSPFLQGDPRAATPNPASCSDRIATTGFVQRNSIDYIQRLLLCHPFVFTFNGRSGDVTLTADDINAAGGTEGLAPLASPAFTGTPTAPTALPATNTNQLATTAFVYTALNLLNVSIGDTYAPLVSPNFGGQPTAPTAAPGSSTAQLATTAFVQDAIVASTTGVASFNTRTGAITLEEADILDAGGAPLASPVFTGVPQAPTAAVGNNSNQVATTAWVLTELGGANIGVSSFNGRGGAVILTSADITGAAGALTASPNFTGVPTAPTAATGTSTNQLATTAFVEAAASASGVQSFNGREGAITLTANDVSAAGALVNPSPALLGTPTAPTPTPGSNSTALATTAYVTAALAAGGGVSSFNSRAGAVTLTAADVNATTAGGPYAPAATVKYRNRIINGDMSVNQRLFGGASPFVAGYTIDRWRFNNPTAITPTFTGGWINNQATTVQAGFDHIFALTMQCSAAHATIAAADNVTLSQAIEAVNIQDAWWGTPIAQPIVVEFWAQASVAGNYAVALVSQGGVRSYVTTFALPAGTGTWTKVRFNVPGDIGGNWNAVAGNTVGMWLTFGLCVGSTYSTPTANAWVAGNFNTAAGVVNMLAAVGQVFNITGVAVMVGAAAANAAPEFRKISDNLLDCMRYYEVNFSTGPTDLNGRLEAFLNNLPAATGPLSGAMGCPFSVPKRASPTITVYSPSTGAAGVVRDLASNVDVAVSAVTTNQRHVRFTATAAAAGASFNLCANFQADVDF